MLLWLRRAGMLRRNADPSQAEMRELLPAAAPKLACPQCGTSGLAVSAADDDDEADWPTARRCQSCGTVIPAERLEVFPDAVLCVQCQERVDNRVPQVTDEFCQRCGWPMVLRTSRGRGITRQVMACSNPQCRAGGR